MAGMEHGGGVGRAHVGAGRDGIIGIFVAVAAEDLPPGLRLQLVAIGVDPAAAIACLAVLEAEAVDHALAVDEDVVGALARILPVGADPIERAFEAIWNRALDDLQPLDGRLAAQRLAPALEEIVLRKTQRFDHVRLLFLSPSSSEEGLGWCRQPPIRSLCERCCASPPPPSPPLNGRGYLFTAPCRQ